jgi:hypothetical protein
MRHRFSASLGTAAVAMAVVWLVTLPVAGQAPTSSRPTAQSPRGGDSGSPAAPAAKKWTAPKTPDGQPDLQGYWTNNGYVPLERPNNVSKEYYTKEEALEAAKRGADRDAEQTVPGTVADVHYDFTQFGLDRSQSPYSLNLRTSLIVDPPDGKLPPPTADGVKRATARAAERKRAGATTDAVQNMPLGTRCIIMGGAGPPMMSAGYNSNYQIVQAPGYVMILVEMIHDVRIIPLDNRPRLPTTIQQWMGDSRGRWEGDTLVVETTNVNGKNSLFAGGGPGGGGARPGTSDQLKVIERFTRVDKDTILYKFTVEDPGTWTRPWTAELPMTRSVGPIFEHACHEGNYGVTNTLAGARLEEQKAAEAAAKKVTQ